jgi:hypothetical protein
MEERELWGKTLPAGWLSVVDDGSGGQVQIVAVAGGTGITVPLEVADAAALRDALIAWIDTQ